MSLTPPEQSPLTDWLELSNAVFLKFIHSTSLQNEMVARLAVAMKAENISEMEHLCAVMITGMLGRQEDMTAIHANWMRLSPGFHARFCADPKCPTTRAVRV